MLLLRGLHLLVFCHVRDVAVVAVVAVVVVAAVVVCDRLYKQHKKDTTAPFSLMDKRDQERHTP